MAVVYFTLHYFNDYNILYLSYFQLECEFFSVSFIVKKKLFMRWLGNFMEFAHLRL